jgi:hypothetical protein
LLIGLRRSLLTSFVILVAKLELTNMKKGRCRPLTS